MTYTMDSENNEKLDLYKEMMKEKAGHSTWGWNIFDLPSNYELTRFFTTVSKEEMRRFETNVFVNGQDPKTYIRIHTMKESDITIELSEEIENKQTDLVGTPNHGGVKGHEGEHASTSSGFRDGYHPCMDHPDYAEGMLKDTAVGTTKMKRMIKIEGQHAKHRPNKKK